MPAYAFLPKYHQTQNPEKRKMAYICNLAYFPEPIHTLPIGTRLQPNQTPRVLLSMGQTTRRELARDNQDPDIGQKGKKYVVGFSTYSNSLLPESDRDPVERNDPYLQLGGLSEPIFKLYTSFTSIHRPESLFAIKLREKLLIRL